MKIILDSLQELGDKKLLKTVVIYPNTDPGCFDILRAMEEFKGSKHMRFYKTLQRKIFVNLLRNASALVGNSSLGILEAPYLGLPVVNIGNRQKGRFTCGNVVFVNHLKSAIKKQITKSCFDAAYRKYVRSLKNVFGDGHTSGRIVKILKNIDPQDKKWKIKKLSYLLK
jgi:GDP/UDP-N,N'-diacetylbacillosamine 2-epimerase (hydrolysing)